MRTFVPRSAVGIAIASVLLLAPLSVLAQAANTNTDSARANMNATIRAALMQDPRTANMSEAQINTMIEALTQKVNQQGVSAADIAWRPYAIGAESLEPVTSALCSGFPPFFCTMSDAYGFTGTDPLIPIALFAASAVFLFVALLMREHNHPHMRFKNAAGQA